MLDDKKIEEAARLDEKEYYDRLSDNDKCFFEYGFRRGYNRALKGLFHPASDVPRNDNGMVLAFSKEIGHRKLYDMNAMLDETDCYTYQDMWENEVNKYCLTNWIFVEELFDMIMKGGKKKRMKKNKHSLKITQLLRCKDRIFAFFDDSIRAEKRNPDFNEITIGEYEDFINSED